ncbi:MAG: hypothetical protein OXK76_02500 [Gammaproteobacteria bacterium]|nr:hypothetical protein [Gammaproteobacteria bacterium]
MVLLDTIPATRAIVDPFTTDVDLTHRGARSLAFTYAGPCTGKGITLRRELSDLSEDTGDWLVEHVLPCSLADATDYRVTVNATGTAGKRYRAELEFATSQGGPRTLSVVDQTLTSSHRVNGLFDRYIDVAVIDEIDSWILRALARVTIGKIADLSWRELTARRAVHGVIAQHIEYDSRNPAGEPATLTGLVAFPDIAGDPDFQHKDRVVVLSHATGSTPSSLSIDDGWLVLATLMAGRGYLVIAPDNFGRGGSKIHPLDGTVQLETYLMANRVAINTLDMVNAVLASDDYRAFRPPDADADVLSIGYSQGGHSAIAFWLAAQVGDVGFKVREVYSGGAPHGLYETVRGTLARLDGRCDDSPWCRDMHLNAVLPYLTKRILPPLVAYGGVGLELDEVVDGDELADDFVAGMLDNEPRYDALKILLQQSSFTNLVELEQAMAIPETRVALYHSPFDRLVPAQNTRDLVELLSPDFDARYFAEECDGALYGVLADRVRIDGLVHTICGLEALDEALQDLTARTSAVSTDAGTETVHREPGGWLDRAETLAGRALADAPALAEFTTAASADDLQTLAGILRETASADLEALADQLTSPNAPP